jgi:hypothetical protein
MTFASMILQQDLNAPQSHFEDEKISGPVMQTYDVESRRMTTITMPVTGKYTTDTKPSLCKGDWRFLAAFGCLSLINLMCAIDATILSVALPVCFAQDNAVFNSLLR